jgi:hypothetical protein
MLSWIRVRRLSPQTWHRFPHNASLSCRFSSGVACSIVRLMISSSSDREQIMLAPPVHNSHSGNRIQSGVEKVVEQIYCVEPSLPPIQATLVRGALVLITPARLAYSEEPSRKLRLNHIVLSDSN